MKPQGLLTNWRFYLMGGILCILPISLVWHLAHLQVIPGAEKGFLFLQSEGEARTLRSQTINAYRGVITDRNGEVLAVSTPVKSLYANPQQIVPEQIPSLAKALAVPVRELKEKFEAYRDKQFVYLARHLPPYQADAVLNQKFAGVAAEQEYRRFYPAGEVMAHVVGFTNIDDRGQEGVELAFNEWLSGAPGYKRVMQDLKGNVIKEVGLHKAPQSGKELQLSIDLRLQYLAYRELKTAIAKMGAKAGTVVMLDVDSGEVLAMVNQPSYNPNNRTRLKPAQLRNRALTDVFEPGSTMKPFTMMAALETGRYSPHDKINTSPGYLKVGSKTFLDHRDYGVIDLTTVITKSSQIGIIKLAFDMEPEQLRNMFFRVGLGQSTGVGFPGESVGILPSRTKWRPVEHATLAFGYGLNANALQLAQAYSVIASGGNFKPVSLLKRNAGEVASHRVVSEKVAHQVTEMLKTVVLPGGTATRAQVETYPVAGKSGTAHKVDESGYADNKYVALFAGFAPADNPKIVTVVVINEPPDGHYFGGEAAAPVFSAIVGNALQMLGVPPVNRDQFLVQVAYP